MSYSVLGVREFHYVYNRPIVARYILCDARLLGELNERHFPGMDAEDIVSAPLSVLQGYEKVMRFRDTKVFEPGIKAAVRKIHEGIRELIMLRALEGEDRYVIREDTISNLNEGDSWTVQK